MEMNEICAYDFAFAASFVEEQEPISLIDLVSEDEEQNSTAVVEEPPSASLIDDGNMDVECSVSEFMELMPTKLSWKNPENKFHIWVFWSHDQCSQPQIQILSPSSSCSVPEILANHIAIKQEITSGLCNYRSYWHKNLLFQFWAPMITDGGRHVLTTRDQPFALPKLHRRLSSYRKHSLCYTFKVDDGDEELLLGLPGRVFRNKLPEATPNVSYYSTTEHPQRDFALNCGVRSSLALPMFEPSGRYLLGVLELVCTDENIDLEYMIDRTKKITHLKYPPSINCFDKNILQPAAVEIDEVLKVVCKTHQLPLAQCWVPGNSSSAVASDGNLKNSCNFVDLSCSKDVMVVTTNATHGEKYEDRWRDFQSACCECYLRKDQGLVGKALLSHKPCFSRDITQFSMTEYPLAHYARNCGSIGCFTICLRSFISGNRDYVLEFFLPSWKIESEDPQTLLSTLITTLKQHFRTFKVASGEELGEELSVAVFISSMNNESDSFEICQSTGSLPQPEALENEPEVVLLDPSDQQLMVEAAIQHERNGFDAEKGEAAISYLEKTCIIETFKTDHRKTENDISYEVPKQHFGRSLDHDTESLNVRWSTIKHLYRKHNISKWPPYKRKKVSGLTSNLKGVGEEQIPESSRSELSCSDTSPVEVAHTIPHTAPMQDLNAVTVKATYNAINIKFQLSFSSGMTELEEKVKKRLKLNDFSIKYLDDEGEWVLIACDEDLRDCMDIMRSLKKTTIRMLVALPITHQAT